MKKFKQGFYKPKNPEKFKYSNKSLNENILELPFYRSSYELQFFKFCDLNPQITEWSSEPFPIFYQHPYKNKKSRYFVDFYIIFKNQKILIEIKPLSQTKPGKTEYHNIQYNINMAKWKSAREFCKERNLKFLILTEKELFNI